MAMIHFYILLVSISSQLPLSFAAGPVNTLASVPELEKLMYLSVDGYPCVRLLNLSGEIGCANPGREKVVAPIVRFKDLDQMVHSSAVLVSLDDMENFFARLSNDKKIAEKVGGVLVESGTKFQNDAKGFSPVEKFPQAEFSPYKKLNYEWNPAGSSIMLNSYNFPVFLLSQDSTVILQEIADKNEKNKQAYTEDMAEFDLVMQTTKTGTHDSESCLKEQSCLPLGGYSIGSVNTFTGKNESDRPPTVQVVDNSDAKPFTYISISPAEACEYPKMLNFFKGSVLSSLPPINISSLQQPKPFIVAVASMDSASFFRDKSIGADSPISGMISLLAAVDALSHVDDVNELTKQLVFLVFTGEAWGYLGSRRFLAELDMHTDAVNGLNSSLIELVMEIGSVGKGFSQGVNSFFAHAAGGSSATNKTLDALQHARKSLGSESIKISMANSSNPGIPPSSLMTFLRKNPLTSGVVLEDFDTAFSNKFYHSHLDDLSNINSSAVAAAASLVARSLYILASDGKELNTTALGSINVNSSLVEELLECLLTCEPGLSCGLVKDYIAPTNTCPNHYVGVFLGPPSSTPFFEQLSDTSRFVWNFLAERTSTPRKNISSDCSEDCSNKGGVCIRAETDGKGSCVISTTRYIPAYSTRLKFDSGQWNVIPANASDVMGMVDPVWTESFWNTIGIRVYTVQSTTYDRLVLVWGIAVTLLAYVAILGTKAFVTKALKHD